MDGGASRLNLIPVSHNYPGFPAGVPGKELLERLCAQANRYEVRMTGATIEQVDKLEDGSFSARSGQQSFRAKTIFLATGVKDVSPEIIGFDHAVQSSCLRYCPVCDGYEAIGKKVAVLGNSVHGASEALFIKHFADELTLLTAGTARALTPQQICSLNQARIEIIDGATSALVCENGEGISVHFADGRVLRFDVLYSALGVRVNSDLAQEVQVDCDIDGPVVVDSHQQTSVAGVYAAGDIVKSLNQISVASGQAAIAVTAILNRLQTGGK